VGLTYIGTFAINRFYSDLSNHWQVENCNIKYTPVLSGENNEWKGCQGLVHMAVLDDFDGFSHYNVYVCGSPDMIEAARKHLVTKGLEPNQFYCDAFALSK